MRRMTQYRLGVVLVITLFTLPVLYLQIQRPFFHLTIGGGWSPLSSESPLYAEILHLSRETFTGSNDTTSSCSNSIQGPQKIADSKGYVCIHDEMNIHSGCCSSGSKRFDCSSCTTKDNCCTEYESCISCCLSPENFIRYGNFYQSKKILQHGVHLRTNDVDNKNKTIISTKSRSTTMMSSGTLIPFDYCSFVCRTNSDSVQSENSYRGGHSHCFGVSKAPLELISVNSDWAGLNKEKVSIGPM